MLAAAALRLARAAKSRAGWALSGAIHAALLVAAMSLTPTAQRPDEPTVLQSSLAAPRLLFEASRHWDVLARERSPLLAELPAVSAPDEDFCDLPHSVLPNRPPDDLPPLGAPSVVTKSPRLGRGASLGMGKPAGKAGPGSGVDAGGGQGARGIAGTSSREFSATGGGGDETGNAIEAALQWLADRQNRDGSWPLSPGWRSCPQSRGSGVVGTSLALLAFTGAGYCEFSAKYGETVRRGLAWLQTWQEGKNEYRDQLHLILVAWPLAEAARLSRNSQTEQVAARAAKQAFPPTAGNRSQRPFLSVWTAMAVRALEDAKLDVPTGSKHDLLSALRVCRLPGGAFGYEAVHRDGEYRLTNRKGGPAENDAGGLAAMLGLGIAPENEEVLGTAARVHDQMSRGLAYGDAGLMFVMLHHGTVAMRLMGGERCEKWREPVFRAVLASQLKTGSDTGAWPARMTGYLWVGDEPSKGTVFATALGARVLEAQLRHSPVYR